MAEWTDYQNQSATRNINLSVSQRTQSILLSALSILEGNAQWLDYNNNSDAIDRAVAQAFFEVMEVQP